MHCALSTLLNQKVALFNKDYALYKTYIDNNFIYINDENEVNEFIIKNATKEFPVIKFEFIPYKLESKNIIYQRINQFLKERLEIVASNEISRSKSRKKTDVNNYKRRAFKKKNTSDQTNNILVLENNIKSHKTKSNMYLIEDFIEEVITDKNDNNKKEGIEISTNFVDDNNSIMKDLSKIKLLLINLFPKNILFLKFIFKLNSIKL